MTNLRLFFWIKKDRKDYYKRNTEFFKEELEAVNIEIGADIEYKIIDSEFEEHQTVHEQLMKDIVAQIPDNSHIYVDITYGPKDLPIVLFTTLNLQRNFGLHDRKYCLWSGRF